MSSSTSSSRARRSYAPIGVALAGWLACTVAWVRVVEPKLPPLIGGTQTELGSFVDVDGADTVLFTFGDLGADTVLFVGDSRVEAGVDLAVAADAGIPDPAILTGPGAQLRDLCKAVRELPPRRLVVALSPLSVYNERRDGPLMELERLRGGWATELIDERLNEWLALQRARFVTVRLIPKKWGAGWFPEPDPLLDNRAYRIVMRAETVAQRRERLEAVRADLQSLLDDGWRIVCSRMPIARGLRRIEGRGLPDESYAGLCAQLGIPFLDYSSRRFETADGGHLTPASAARLTQRLAADLATRTTLLAGD